VVNEKSLLTDEFSSINHILRRHLVEVKNAGEEKTSSAEMISP